MRRAVIVRGRLSDPRHIELEEDLPEMRGPVEVAVRPIQGDVVVPLFDSTTNEEWERMFHAWIDGHDRTVPVPPAEALRREALYEDRW
jgi:hypothetical protein